MILQDLISSRPGESRRASRALVPATALVMTEGRPATQHLTYDLSTGGVRLCGVPQAQPGDDVQLLLDLPSGRRLPASGRLLRRDLTDGQPDFAIEFSRLPAHAEDVVQNEVLKALAHKDRPRLLLFGSECEEEWPGFDWLKPILSSCAPATTLPTALKYLEQLRIEIGLFSKADRRSPQSYDWREMYPGIIWRTIDAQGRLAYPVALWQGSPTSRVGGTDR